MIGSVLWYMCTFEKQKCQKIAIFKVQPAYRQIQPKKDIIWHFGPFFSLELCSNVINQFYSIYFTSINPFHQFSRFKFSLRALTGGSLGHLRGWFGQKWTFLGIFRHMISLNQCLNTIKQLNWLYMTFLDPFFMIIIFVFNPRVVHGRFNRSF